MPETSAPKAPPQNAPGPFLVEEGMCMTCGMPEMVAPDLIAGTHDGHCYFKKQPTTTEELERAIEAVQISCCGAVMYVGDDPVVRSRLEVLGR